MDIVALQQAQAYAKRNFAAKFPGVRQRRASDCFLPAAGNDIPALAQLATTSQVSGGRAWPAATNAGTTMLTSEFFAYNCAGSIIPHGALSPDFNYVRFTSLTNGSSPGAPYAVDFDVDDSVVELRFKQISGVWKISVNGKALYLSTQIIVAGNPTGGTFSITIGGQTATVAPNATATTIQTALAALSSVGAGNVTVAGGVTSGASVGNYLITLCGTAQGQAITTSATGLTGGTSPSLVVQASPVVGMIQTGSLGFQKLTFPTSELRHFRFEAVGIPWGGLTTTATGSVTPGHMQTKRPRVICCGDSYTEGANNVESALMHWPRWLGELMGWDDVWSSGSGGTGWMNPGSVGGRVKMRDRVQNDVINQGPDIVIYMMGHNDIVGYTAGQVQSEVTLTLQQVAAALPDCLQVVLGPILSNGVDGGVFSGANTVIATRDAMKAAVAAAGVAKAVFIDPVEMPLSTTAIATTIAATAGSGATSGIQLVAPVPIGSLVDFEGKERRRVTALSGVGPYFITVTPATSQQHNTGTAVTQVGPTLITGQGNIGAPSGAGNADVYTGNDGVHPTPRGQKAIALWVASALTRLALPAA